MWKASDMEGKQFAEKVVSFSSQYGAGNSRSYTAGNLAGESYNFPCYGDFTQAFVLVSTMPGSDLFMIRRRVLMQT